MIIIPTILEADPEELLKKLELVKQMGGRAQVDVLDGILVPEKTADLETLAETDTGLQLDLHLMVKEPTSWLNRSLAALPNMIIAEVEGCSDVWEFINQASEAAIKIGVALDLTTPIDIISEDLYHMVDMVLLLAAPMGESGQPFDKRVLVKIEKIRNLVGELVDIGVDCGLNEQTISESKLAGANIFCVNSSIWKAVDPVTEYQRLTKLVEIG